MDWKKFYGHFAAAYGTIWLGLLAVAVLTQSHINAGTFGMIGFPAIAIVYAVVRTNSRGEGESELTALKRKVARLERLLAERSG